MYLSVCLSICLSICLFVGMPICPCVNLSMCLSVHASICTFVHLSICPCVCLSLCLSVSEWPNCWKWSTLFFPKRLNAEWFASNIKPNNSQVRLRLIWVQVVIFSFTYNVFMSVFLFPVLIYSSCVKILKCCLSLHCLDFLMFVMSVRFQTCIFTELFTTHHAIE